VAVTDKTLSGPLSTLIRTRRSVRKFQSGPIDRELIREVFEDVRFMPCPTNRLCFRFILVEDHLRLEAMRQEVVTEVEAAASALAPEDADTFRKYADYFTFFTKAPGTIVGLYRTFVSRLPSGGPGSDSIQGLSEVQAFGGAVGAALLALEARGISACWMTGPLIAERRILRVLEVEDPWRLGAIIPIGLAEERPVCPKKPDLDRIFSLR
jgi:coenzyme F420-0:L-glutamate ligase/coenzyme F420-1:gamma-L-glutamate ligase